MTPEQREILWACEALLEALDGNVPWNVVHYAVTDAYAAVDRLRRVVEGVKTFDLSQPLASTVVDPAIDPDCPIPHRRGGTCAEEHPLI